MNGKSRWGIFALLLLFSVAGAEGESPPLQVKVELKNGNRFTGDLLTKEGKDLQVKPYWLDSALNFTYDDLSLFEQLQPVREADKGGYRIQFPSGNHLMLRSLGLSESGQFSGETLWGGALTLPRYAVGKLEFLNPEGLLYFGPEVKLPDEKDPVVREVILPKPGVYWKTGPIQFPELFQLEIDLKTNAKDFIYQVSLFDWETRITGSVVYEFSPDRASAAWYVKVSPKRMNVRNWREGIKENPGRQKMLFLVNLKENHITLILNGEKVHTWEEDVTETLRVHKPYRIGFRYLSGNGNIIVESIRLMPWDGELPQPQRYTGTDHILFKDGKRVTGKVSEITDSKVVLDSGEGQEPDSYDTAKILEVQLTAGGDRFEAVPPRGMARLFFDQGEGTALPIRVESLGEGRLQGEVWTGGASFKISVPLPEVQKIDFMPGGRP